MGAAPAAGGQATSALIGYEASADAAAWAPACAKTGCVALPADAGSVATVEASWTAQTTGSLPAPQLRLRDVAQQEVHGAGSAGTVACV